MPALIDSARALVTLSTTAVTIPSRWLEVLGFYPENVIEMSGSAGEHDHERRYRT